MRITTEPKVNGIENRGDGSRDDPRSKSTRKIDDAEMRSRRERRSGNKGDIQNVHFAANGTDRLDRIKRGECVADVDEVSNGGEKAAVHKRVTMMEMKRQMRVDDGLALIKTMDEGTSR